MRAALPLTSALAIIQQVTLNGWVKSPAPPKPFSRMAGLRVATSSAALYGPQKMCWRDPQILVPERFEIEMEDEDGNIDFLTGHVIASVPGFHWPNIATHLALVEWQWNGTIGYGESQDVQWNDYVYHCGQVG